MAGIAGCLGIWAVLGDSSRVPTTDSWLIRVGARLGRFRFDDPSLMARITVSRLALLFTFACGFALAGLYWRQVKSGLRRFFDFSAHPINLAVFRIVVFVEIYRAAWTELIAGVAAQPNELQFPPYTGVPEIGPLAAFSYWPVNPLTSAQVTVLIEAMKVACVAGALGLFSRTSAALAGLLMFAGWGTQQWYGKVDHFHHMVWFAGILALCRCGDALSVDSVWRSFRRGRKGDPRPPEASTAYGTPLRVCMLLMGVLYFFPGFHKMWTSGFDWFFGPSAGNQLHLKWHLLGGWLPPFRVDRYPLLLTAGALGTVLFEMGFIFLIFGRRTRILAGIVGVSFHTGLNIIGRYGFESLRNCYVMFVDWRRLLSWVGARMFHSRLHVSFAANTGGRAGMVRGLDWLDAVEWEDSLLPTGSIEATSGSRTRHGWAAWRVLALRIPLLWPLAPLLMAIPAAWASADARSNDGAPGSGRLAVSTPHVPRPAVSLTGVLLLGGFLFVANAWAGLQRQQEGWPIASYPLFDGLTPDHYRTLGLTLVLEDGSERAVDVDQYRDQFGTRWNFEVRRVLDEWDEERRAERLRSVWDLISSHEAGPAPRSVRFYELRLLIDPDRHGEPSAPPELLLEIVL